MQPLEQLDEVVSALDLARDIEPYSRCLECNGELESISRLRAARQVPLQVFPVYRDFRRCRGCGRIYWGGSHQSRLDAVIERVRGLGTRE